MKSNVNFYQVVIVFCLLFFSFWQVGLAQGVSSSKSTEPKATEADTLSDKPVEVLSGFKHMSKESATCISCHREKTPGIYGMWGKSKHFGANVGCYECHKAQPGEKDAIKHKDFVISVIVSPKDCGTCHERETKEFEASHHATAGNILGSLDNVLAEVIEGAPLLHGTSPVVSVGCASCHGSIVRVESDGSLNSSTWPNSGIGRINPDGSQGACSACHLRHNFDKAQARHPDNCGRCHLGPDHPQKEIYEESVHGVAFRAHVPEMHLDSDKWIVGEDYTAAPTCATCHMSGTKDLPVTHDSGSRISWDLRSPVSRKIDAKAIEQGKEVKPWLERRKDMKSVCSACHGRNIVDNHYEQLDAFIDLYNNKFALPGSTLMKALLTNKLLDSVQFNEKVEWTWFYLWHHEGRRARHGAAMFGPDFAHWEGLYEVAHRFYMELVPEIREIIQHGKETHPQGAANVQKVLDEILSSEMHRWFKGEPPPKAWSPKDTDNHGFKLETESKKN